MATRVPADSVMNSKLRRSVSQPDRSSAAGASPPRTRDQVLAQAAEIKRVEFRAGHGLQAVAQAARRLVHPLQVPRGSLLATYCPTRM